MADSASEPTYLIVGGTTKAATTSIFSYLRDHPQICGASLKETRYFLDPSYPLPIPRSYADEGGEGYERYFRSCREKPVRVEATPDYLYSRPTPDLLQRHLSDVRCLFVLRDPIDRLISWYRFARQNGQIRHGISFDEYATRQLRDGTSTPSSLPWSALEQGRYARYLQRYVDVLGADSIMVSFFEHVVGDPEQSVRRMAEFAKVDGEFYGEYEFDVHNETQPVKSPFVHSMYHRALRAVRYRVHTWPRVHAIFRRLRSWVDLVYYALAAEGDQDSVEVTPELRARLQRYYADDVADLVDLVGRRPPWSVADALQTN